MDKGIGSWSLPSEGLSRISLGDVEIVYSISGKGQDPIVLVHGFGGDHLTWTFVRPPLKRQAVLIAPDLPGHGGSDKRIAGGDYEAMAKCVVAMMDALGVAQAHLVGHSMGGGIAIAIALNLPERVRSLTLLAPAGIGWPSNRIFMRDFLALNQPEQVFPLLSQIFSNTSVISSKITEMMVAYKRTPGVQECLENIAAALFDDRGYPKINYARRMTEIRVPIEVVWGADDQIIPIHASTALPSGTRLTRLPNVGHAPQLEAPAEVVAAIRRAIAASGS